MNNHNINNEQTKEEWLPLVNQNGQVIGKAPRSMCHNDKSYLHPVVHLHVINSKGEIFLQKRPLNKIQPGRWDTAVGGHIAYGETVEAGLQREAMEEIGIKDVKARFVHSYVWESDIEREFVYSFIIVYNEPIQINKAELDDGKFWSEQEITGKLGTGIFTPNFEDEYARILPFLQNIQK